jgi:hypothetical protein
MADNYKRVMLSFLFEGFAVVWLFFVLACTMSVSIVHFRIKK